MQPNVRRMLAALAVVTVMGLAATAAVGIASSTSMLTFNGSFSSGLAPWLPGHPQCANYGTPPKPPRLRGTFTLDTSIVARGSTASGRFDLPANTNKTYSLEQCEIFNAPKPIVVPADDYYGLMVYVPQGEAIPSHGVEIAQYYFQAIFGAPIHFSVYPGHITLALQMGACKATGCQYHSNADNNVHGTLPAEYVIPPGALVQGQWNEVLMQVHWAGDSTGSIHTWYKVQGASAWTPSASLSGYPTVQWKQGTTCCSGNYDSMIGAYSFSLSAPFSIWLDHQVEAPSQAAVAAALP